MGGSNQPMENKSNLASKAEATDLKAQQPLVADAPKVPGNIYKVPVVRSYPNKVLDL